MYACQKNNYAKATNKSLKILSKNIWVNHLSFHFTRHRLKPCVKHHEHIQHKFLTFVIWWPMEAFVYYIKMILPQMMYIHFSVVGKYQTISWLFYIDLIGWDVEVYIWFYICLIITYALKEMLNSFVLRGCRKFV